MSVPSAAVAKLAANRCRNQREARRAAASPRLDGSAQFAICYLPDDGPPCQRPPAKRSRSSRVVSRGSHWSCSRLAAHWDSACGFAARADDVVRPRLRSPSDDEGPVAGGFGLGDPDCSFVGAAVPRLVLLLGNSPFFMDEDAVFGESADGSTSGGVGPGSGGGSLNLSGDSGTSSDLPERGLVDSGDGSGERLSREPDCFGSCSGSASGTASFEVSFGVKSGPDGGGKVSACRRQMDWIGRTLLNRNRSRHRHNAAGLGVFPLVTTAPRRARGNRPRGRPALRAGNRRTTGQRARGRSARGDPYSRSGVAVLEAARPYRRQIRSRRNRRIRFGIRGRRRHRSNSRPLRRLVGPGVVSL